jgi:hypothetical protein
MVATIRRPVCSTGQVRYPIQCGNEAELFPLETPCMFPTCKTPKYFSERINGIGGKLSRRRCKVRCANASAVTQESTGDIEDELSVL